MFTSYRGANTTSVLARKALALQKIKIQFAIPVHACSFAYTVVVLCKLNLEIIPFLGSSNFCCVYLLTNMNGRM